MATGTSGRNGQKDALSGKGGRAGRGGGGLTSKGPGKDVLTRPIIGKRPHPSTSILLLSECQGHVDWLRLWQSQGADVKASGK